MGKNKIWLMGSVLFAELGSSIFTFALSLSILAKTNSATAYSTVLVVGAVTSIILTPLIGYIVDRFPKRALLIGSQLVSIVSLLVFGLFLQWGGQVSVISVSILTVFLNISDISYGSTLMTSAVYIVSSEEQLIDYNSTQQSMSSFASMMGPLLAGAAYSFINLKLFLGFEVFCEVIAIIFFLKLPYSKRPSIRSTDLDSDSISTNNATFVETIKYLLKEHVVLLLMLGMLLINFLMSSLTVGLPYVVFTKLSGNSLSIGLIEIAVPVGMIVASLVMPYLKFKRRELSLIVLSWIVCGILIASNGVVIQAFASPLVVFTALIFLISLLIRVVLVTGKIPLVTYMQKQIQPKQQGKVFSLLDAFVQVAVPLGTAVFGFLFDRLAAPAIFIIAGTLIALFSVILVPLGLRDVPGDEQD